MQESLFRFPWRPQLQLPFRIPRVRRRANKRVVNRPVTRVAAPEPNRFEQAAELAVSRLQVELGKRANHNAASLTHWTINPEVAAAAEKVGYPPTNLRPLRNEVIQRLVQNKASDLWLVADYGAGNIQIRRA